MEEVFFEALKQNRVQKNSYVTEIYFAYCKKLVNHYRPRCAYEYLPKITTINNLHL